MARDEQLSSQSMPISEASETQFDEPARITRFTSERPAILSKSFAIGPDNKLCCTNGGMMSSGRCEIVAVADLTEFAGLLRTLGSRPIDFRRLA